MGTSSHSVLAGPFTGGGLVLALISLILVSNVGDKRIIWVGVAEEGADGQQNFRNGESRTPLVLQDVQADATVRVDIGVVNTGREVTLWGLERVVGGEVDVQEVDSARVGRLIRSLDGGLPVELVLLVDGASRAVAWGVSAQINQLLLNSFICHLFI